MREYGKIGFHFIFNSSDIEEILNKIFDSYSINEVLLNNWAVSESTTIDKNDIRNNLARLNDDQEIFIVFKGAKKNELYNVTYSNDFIEIYYGFWYPHKKELIDSKLMKSLFENCMFCVFGFELEVYDKDVETTIDELKSYEINLPFYLYNKESGLKYFGGKGIDCSTKSGVLNQYLSIFPSNEILEIN